jgi:hypothetical protein
MAGDWIKMRGDLAEDPAVIGIAGRLGAEEDLIVGKLHRLWAWADRQSRDGHAASVTEVWVDRFVGRDGFASAMQAVGWLAVDATGISFPNFERHNGKTAKTRGLSANRQQSRRARVTPESREPSRNVRDASVTREEKRREEILNPPTPRKRGPSFDPSAIELPEWLPRDAWSLWCEDRRKRGKAITDAGARLQVKALQTYRAEGHEPQAVIEHSIAGGYQGLYPPKGRAAAASTSKQEALEQRNAATAQRVLDELEAERVAANG